MKAVILAAGLGTRLLPVTKETPKVMLPLFAVGKVCKLCLKPVLQAVFEQLHDVGIREFCFVVGRGKFIIKEYFKPDHGFINCLKEHNKKAQAVEMEDFYKRITDSNITFVNQSEMKGTGEAVYRARSFTANEPFLLHMGDDIVLSKQNSHLKRLILTFENRKADATFLVAEVPHPQMYGVVKGKQVTKGLIKVSSIIYQPKKPASNLSDVTAYMLKPSIFPEIGNVKPLKESGEVSLIPAIQRLIDKKGKVYGVKLEPHEKRIDIGDAVKYREALNTTYNYFAGEK